MKKSKGRREFIEQQYAKRRRYLLKRIREIRKQGYYIKDAPKIPKVRTEASIRKLDRIIKRLNKEAVRVDTNGNIRTREQDINRLRTSRYEKKKKIKKRPPKKVNQKVNKPLSTDVVFDNVPNELSQITSKITDFIESLATDPNFSTGVANAAMKDYNEWLATHSKDYIIEHYKNLDLIALEREYADSDSASPTIFNHKFQRVLSQVGVSPKSLEKDDGEPLYDIIE